MAAQPARLPKNPALIDEVRAAARGMEVSGIVEMMKYGFGREGIIPLWAGEGDLPTPDFICEAAARSLRAGETFYTHQRGIPELRSALAAYHARLYGGMPDAERFYVTASGMHAIALAFAMTLNEGDEVVIPSPSWPNAGAAADAAVARPVFVPMNVNAAGFALDLDRLADVITPRTRAIFVNTPGNPTGWTATPEVEAWIKFSITCPSDGSASIQPMRQPVIAQFLENVLTKRMRSPSDITSWKDGARAPSPQ